MGVKQDSDGTIFSGEKANKEKTGKPPVLKNDNDGAAAWMHADKNGNAYLSVKLPLGLGSLNLFPVNDEMTDAFNQLFAHLEQEDCA